MGQLRALDSLLLPAAGEETLGRSALPSPHPELFRLALNWEVTFLAAFILRLAISGPGWQVLIEVSEATCSSTAAQPSGGLLRAAVSPCTGELGLKRVPFTPGEVTGGVARAGAAQGHQHPATASPVGLAELRPTSASHAAVGKAAPGAGGESSNH